MSRKIVFNGREYGSPEEMPPDVRRDFEAAQSLLAEASGPEEANCRREFKFAIRTTPGHGGTKVRTYSSPEEMPPEVRRLWEEAVSTARSGTEDPDCCISLDVTSVVDMKVSGPKVFEIRNEVSSGTPPPPAGQSGLPEARREFREWDPRDERGGRDGGEGRGASAERILLLALAVLAGLALVLGLAWLIARAG